MDLVNEKFPQAEIGTATGLEGRVLVGPGLYIEYKSEKDCFQVELEFVTVSVYKYRSDCKSKAADGRELWSSG